MSTGTEDPVADKRVPACSKLNAMQAGRLPASAMNRSEQMEAAASETQQGSSSREPGGTQSSFFFLFFLEPQTNEKQRQAGADNKRAGTNAQGRTNVA